MNGFSDRARTPLSRRALLSLGGLTLLSACGARHPSTTTPRTPVSPAEATRSRVTRTGALPDLIPHLTAGSPAAPLSSPQYYVHSGDKVIALTIDDGPSPRYTPRVLELLREYQITATFCEVGRNIHADPGMSREVAQAGHLIANHTYTHSDVSKLSLSAIRDEIKRANDALAAVGVRPALFRAPYGAWSRPVFTSCAEAGLRPLDWSVDPRDWARPGVNSIVSNIMSHTRPGSIVLEHDGGGDRSQTVAALSIVIPRLLEEGYHFTTP